MPLENHAELPIVDMSGLRILPIGTDNFLDAVERGVYVDKSSLVADLLDSGYKATLFCRPRRFGKSLAMSMLRRFFEAPMGGKIPDSRPIFEQLAVWGRGERYRAEQGRYPVVAISLGDCGGLAWEECRAAIARHMVAEFRRHRYATELPGMDPDDRGRYLLMCKGVSAEDLPGSLSFLVRALSDAHEGSGTVVLIDEYEHPVTQGHLRGYRNEAVAFMRDWLTGALKSNESLRLACLTGVQHVSRESIFSGLNNLAVNTPMSERFTEGFGFTEEEAARLAEHVGRSASVAEMRDWYDGYSFGGAPVYNPWSVLNYLDQGIAQVYWVNTADNGVIGRLFERADSEQLAKLWGLASGGEVVEPLNLNTVFADLDRDPAAMWGQLYLAGYVTTDDVAFPNDAGRPRRLRIPNREVAEVYRQEICRRAMRGAGVAPVRALALRQALPAGDAGAFVHEMDAVLQGVPSYYDLSTENAYHMLLAGLLYDMQEYRAPLSNRESGEGRPDILLVPELEGLSTLPAVVIEVKRAQSAEGLREAAERGVEQARLRGYAADLPGKGALLWGVAFCGKACAAICERA